MQSTCACCKTVFTVPNVPENTVLVRFDVLLACIFDAVTGGKDMVQLKIGTAKNQRITGSDQHKRTRPLANDSAAPADAAPAAPAPEAAAAPAAAEAEGAALEDEPAVVAEAAPRSPAGKGKRRAGKGGG